MDVSKMLEEDRRKTAKLNSLTNISRDDVRAPLGSDGVHTQAIGPSKDVPHAASLSPSRLSSTQEICFVSTLVPWKLIKSWMLRERLVRDWVADLCVGVRHFPKRILFSCPGRRYLNSLVRENTQLLFNEIWGLPVTKDVDGVFAKLPAGTTRQPREKPVSVACNGN